MTVVASPLLGSLGAGRAAWSIPRGRAWGSLLQPVAAWPHGERRDVLYSVHNAVPTLMPSLAPELPELPEYKGPSINRQETIPLRGGAGEKEERTVVFKNKNACHPTVKTMSSIILRKFSGHKEM